MKNKCDTDNKVEQFWSESTKKLLEMQEFKKRIMASCNKFVAFRKSVVESELSDLDFSHLRDAEDCFLSIAVDADHLASFLKKKIN